jgi:PKD repeat protein
MRVFTHTIFALSFIWMILQSSDLQSQSCCPDFILSDAVEICPPEGSCSDNPQGFGRILSACRLTNHTYTVYPNDPSFTYTWTVTGGTPATYTGNPATILWGNGATGFIKVVITANDTTLNCTDSISREVCLIDGPMAGFTLTPDTVCVNTPVLFTNTSVGGSVFTWDFGDGTIYTGANPPGHSYGAPGIYTITLTAKDMGEGKFVGGANGEAKVPCGCSDTATATVVVLPGTGPQIETDCCYGTVCPGDTSSFCTTMACGTYNWSVTGGTILPPGNTACIQVVWDTTYTEPTTVTLESCTTSSCPGATTINVPVLYPNLPINGPSTLCIGASGTYSLPVLPGTFYNWSVSGGPAFFNQQDKNVPVVNISFLFPGNYWIKCELNNPLSGCNGVDSVMVEVLPKFSITGNDVACEGTPVFFNAPAASTWSISPAGATINSGQGTSTVSISFPPGDFVVTAVVLTPGTYCNDTATKNVESIAKPILNNITGPDTVCPGENYTYHITSNTSGSPFVWSVISGSGSVLSEMGEDNDSVIVQFSGAGPWNLEVYQEIEISPGNFCQSLPVNKIIHPFPPPLISGQDTVCVDAVEVFSIPGSSPPGGFQWSVTPSNRGTIQSGQGTNSAQILWHGPSATATVTATGCSGSDNHSVVINVPPVAVATPDTTPVFCLNDVLTLNISTPFNAGYSYQWYEDNVLMSGETGSTLSLNIASFTLPGTYQYNVEVTENGCTTKSNLVNVVIEDCSVFGPGGVPDTNNCPVVSFFRAYTVCDQITLINKSYAVSPATIINYQWSITGPGTGTFTPNANDPSPGLTVSASGSYTITLVVTSSTGCISTWVEVVDVLLPTADFTYSLPACEGDPVTFTAIPNNPNFNYLWDFGDGSNSYEPVTEHAYATGNPTQYTVSLLITDSMGCTAFKQDSLVVNPKPNCMITATDTIFCPGSFVTLTACDSMMAYQWYKDGDPIATATAATLNVSEVGEFYVVATNMFGCSSMSNKIFIYRHQPPKAEITGEGYHCALPGGTIGFGLQTKFDANYSYSWSSIPSGATFSPPTSSNTYATLTVPFTLPAYYQFVVHVTDNITGCTNTDTLCVTIFETPALSIVSTPALDQCEGTPVTLVPNINNTALYDYLWSNGATDPVITVSNPGFYSLTITNKATGCSATKDAGFIRPKPDLSLFPIGCDSLCEPDSLHLYIPLPLDQFPPFNTYGTAYPSITWYDYGTAVGTGPTYSFPAGTSGDHEFSVVVQNAFGCTDSTGVFCLSSSCCNIVVDSLDHWDAPCPEVAGGGFTITLGTASSGGPFTITSVPLVSPLPATITPGVPLTVNNLAAGSYTIIISGASGDCHETFPVTIDNLAEECCLAESDSLYVKIFTDPGYTSDVVWDGKYYIDDNVLVTVSNGAVLDVTNVDVVFGECAGILFTEGAYLRSNNSVYRPCEVDGTWKGLRFVSPGKFDNIINECTFKNAEVALYFQQNSDAVVSNSLFSNCNYGIRVEGNYSFNHPISGNRFVTEQFYPDYACATKYGFINNFSTYGIYTKSSQFIEQVSHNDFINSRGTAWPRSYGIFQTNGGGVFSYNTFTDLSYSIFVNAASFPTIIENNEIEINEVVSFTIAPVYISSTTRPIVEVNTNEISDNYRQYNCFSAIYARSSANVSIVNNQIDGFQVGVFVNNGRSFQISRNTIVDADVIGIYFRGKGNFANYITCNEVKMRSFANSRGLYAIDLTPFTEISTNCFNDSYTAMDFRTFSGASLPRIRNNFLYNYTFAGINADGYSGDIGTASPPDPGLNTLWSNYNPAIDINSNTNITVADNFGMFNIAWPFVQITSNNPFHSTASCAQQIFNMPSQGNLDENYTCDNFRDIFIALEDGTEGQYELSDDYRELLQSSAHPFEDAAFILSTLAPSQTGLVNDILGQVQLSENEQKLLLYHHYRRIGDNGNARMYMNQYMPQNEDKEDYKSLCLLGLDIDQNGWGSMTESDISWLNQIMEKESPNSNMAISLLNNSPEYRDYLFETPEVEAVVPGGEIRQIDYGDSRLFIHPNPATHTVWIKNLAASLADNELLLFDGSGKQVSNYSVRRMSSGMELDISNLNAGFYFITVVDKNTGMVRSGKLIKTGQSGK